MPEIFIGCSGFHYKEWKEVFYPQGLPQTKWFEFYATKFNTLEINSSFYKFPTLKSLQKWYSVSPADFRFSMKAPRVITHYNKFSNCAKYATDFYNLCREGLQDKLGCILFQLPPQIKYSEEMLGKILCLLDTSFKNVLEFRHESWWNEDVFSKLQNRNITYAGISYPKLPDPAIAAMPLVYYRFHGVPVLYKSSYDEIFLREKFLEIIKGTQSAERWIYFNNTWGTAAINNAIYLQHLARQL
ncbi:MAG: DUF72 domain-containing protein [Ginsengibacter sp.]